MGIFVAAWGLLLVSSIDNVLRPYLLTKSNSLPVLLGLFGFIGGILAFGFIGVFLGPTLLAVGYSLFLEWHAAEVEDRRRRPWRPDLLDHDLRGYCEEPLEPLPTWAVLTPRDISL